MYITNQRIFIYPRVDRTSPQETTLVLFNPDNRRRFTIPREEDFPQLLKVLLFCSQGARSEQELIDGDFDLDSEDVQNLVSAGILLEKEKSASNDDSTYISIYQSLVHNYPFGDYELLETVEAEEALMEEYAGQALPPPSYLARKGKLYTLPQLPHHEIPSSFLERLARVLDYTFGAFGTLKGNHGTFLHKISPSGGARHPTEGVVVLGADAGNIPAGVYSYDFAEKALVDSEPEDIKPLMLERFKGCKAAIVVRSRVERPMWRYREPRSYRPIVVDAGHVIETARLLCQHFGSSCQVSSPVFIADSQGEWLKEPYLAAVAIEPGKDYKPPNAIISQKIANDDPQKRVVINPASFYTLKNGKVIAHTLFPSVAKKELSLQETGGIFTTANQDAEAIQSLRKLNFLLSEETTRSIEEGFSFWAVHDWDLSLLAYLNTSNLESATGVLISGGQDNKPVDICAPEHLIETMFKRFTDRSLTRDGTTAGALQELLLTSLDKEMLGDDIDTFVVSFSIEGMEPGVYQWNLAQGQLERKTSAPAPELLRAATIGQKWATRGAASIILAHRLQENPISYNAALIRLGMLGQRICLAATSLKLGSFMTPALNDKDVSKLLSVPGASQEKIFYLVDVGASAMSQQGRVPSTYATYAQQIQGKSV